MKALVRLVGDDSGQNLVEYALLTGMVGVGALVFAALVSLVLGFQYSTWLTSVYNAWQPCSPAPAACP